MTINRSNYIDKSNGELVLFLMDQVGSLEVKNALIKILIDEGRYGDIHTIIRELLPEGTKANRPIPPELMRQIFDEAGPCPFDSVWDFDGLDKDWIAFARSGSKIEAIKNFRSIYGCGLKRAKDCVEYFIS